VPKEVATGERRVALVPAVVSKLTEGGFEVVVEAGAGAAARYGDDQYQEAGAKTASSAAELFGSADGVLKVREPAQGPTGDELEQMREGTLLIGFLQPLTSADLVKRLVDRRITSFAMEAIPRTTRAQSMDALSSQAVCAGYRGTLAAAESLGKFFPMLITAAGTAAPARVLVLGAGVAGLQAIATARRLGAVVEAYDVRPAVKEEVESLGAKFVQIEVQQQGEGSGSGEYAKELPEETQRRQRELLADRVSRADCVITTAAVPGRPAPKLVTEDMVSAMQPGSVIVDLAAETGGNCDLTEPDQVVERHGVTIDGRLNLPSRMPFHASLLYANNVANLLTHLAPEGELSLDLEDEITAGACITHDGRIINERVREQNKAVGQQADRPVGEGMSA
jgi:proton-translocating NAD(P)+ transhydrogenase subunit alpha